MKFRRYLIVVVCLMALGFSLILPVRQAAAHGDGSTLQLAEVPVGPYQLSVWTYPAAIRVGDVHFSTAVVHAANNLPATDCEVIIEATRIDSGGPILQTKANAAEAITGFLHEANLTIADTGRYLVTITVVDPGGVRGEATFEIDVLPQSIVLKWLTIVLLIQAAVVTAWMFREGLTVWSKRSSSSITA